MRHIIRKSLIVLAVLALVLSGCNLPVRQTTQTSPPAIPVVTNTQEVALATETSSPGVTPATDTPSPSPSPSPTPISHVDIPSDSVYVADQVTVDCSTAGRMAAGSTQIVISGCDYWNREMLERPADSLTSPFIPSLDIQWAQAGKSFPWIYLKVLVQNYSTPPDGFKVGFELDTDLDSRGEFLLLANKPSSTQWTTEGVQIWQDVNGDVGGTKPFSYDENTGDGYETKVFDSGVGSDADLAWVRISPKNANQIEFAFKAALLPNQKVFGWWAWVGLTNISPDKFEIVDRDQDAQTWDVDNSCSWIFGKTPVPEELVNLCKVITPTPTPKPTAVPTVNVPVACQVTPCRIGMYFDTTTCSCRRLIFIIPSPTPIPQIR